VRQGHAQRIHHLTLLNSTAAIVLVLVLAAVAANLPFMSNRLGLVGPQRQPKPFVWCLIELGLLGALVVGVGVYLESNLGQVHPQGWQFYVAMGCFFITLAFPGFVWSYLKRKS
jgi:Protein of unknown function (DUF2818)